MYSFKKVIIPKGSLADFYLSSPSLQSRVDYYYFANFEVSFVNQITETQSHIIILEDIEEDH